MTSKAKSRWSPARPRASASPSPGRSPPKAPRLMINGFGDPAEIERECERARRDPRRRRPVRPGGDRADDAPLRRRARRARHPRQQCRHPARLAGRGFPGRKWDAIIAINLSAVFHTTRLALPAMKQKGWGRIINTASRAQPRRLAQQVGLCRGQARRRRLHQDGRAGGGDATASPSIASRPATSGRRWSRSQIPDTMKARGLTREQVMNDVLLAAQPTKRFVTPEEVAALALFLCRDEAALDHRRQPQHGRRLDCRLGCRGDARRSRVLRLPLLALARPCTTRRAPSAQHDRRTGRRDWRQVATDERPRAPARLAQRVRRRRSTAARNAGHAAEIAREGALLDPDAALGRRRRSPTASIAAA